MERQTIGITKLKLKAFTVMEAVVTMVVTGLLIGLSGTVIIIFSKQVNGARSSFEEAYQVKLFDTLLSQDWEKTVSISGSDFGVTFEMTGGHVHYEFRQSFVVRTSPLSSDTFPMSRGDMKVVMREEGTYMHGSFTLKGGNEVAISKVRLLSPEEIINQSRP